MNRSTGPFGTAVLAACILASAGVGQASQSGTGVTRPVITVDGVEFYSWQEYTSSELFRLKELRCGKPETQPGAFSSTSDCSGSSTTILPEYDPDSIIDIPVVVHIIEHSNGDGQISDPMVQSQIDILNEDFRAISGAPGENGSDSMINFYLANTDPDGNPTTGITRTVNNSWYDDSGNYWDPLHWDTNRYLNIYTNSAGGFLGYAFLPQGGSVGESYDRIVILWSSFGRDAPIGPPYDQGRTTTHEVGHWLGLDHTFSGGCSGGDCYSEGDLICDTNSEQSPTFGCPGSKSSCGNSDPFDNYMDYSDDLCMEQFTPEQINRMRCTAMNWRPDSDCPEGGVVTRTGGGSNLDSAYTATESYLGQPVSVSIDMSSTDHSLAYLFAYTEPDNVVLGGGQVILLDFTSFKVFSIFGSGPVVNFDLGIPNETDFCGITLYTQAAVFGGAGPFQFTNAQDWTLGM